MTGRVEQGIVRTGDEVEIVGIRPTSTKSTVTGERGNRRVQLGRGAGAVWQLFSLALLSLARFP